MKKYRRDLCRRPSRNAVAALAVLLLVSGCNLIDNQTIVSSSDRSLADPAPTSRDFRGNNAKHKVLMALIDSGMDYNHPKLANNIHFKLDGSGKPVGAGRDLIGNDNWPAPYVVRTSVYNPDLSDRKKAEALAEYGKMNKLVASQPGLLGYLNPNRNTKQEFTAGAYHGTHVAGLMTYDRPDFGLMGYRVLPSNESTEESHDYTTESIDQIIGGIEQAVADGARVVNMSLGMDFQKAVQAEDGEAAEKNFEKVRELFRRLNAVVVKYPQVLFVSAAGNGNSWKDGENRAGMPCGVKADNSLCVGALREGGDPAPFTDITINGVDLVFALGHKVLSTLPTKMCVRDAMQKLMFFSEADVPTLGAELASACATYNGMGKLSGTSMASPLVAHVAAEILADDPGLTGKEVIGKIYDQAFPSFIGTIPVYKLRIKKPSWYKPATPPTVASGMFGEHPSFAEADDGDMYWEGVALGKKEN